MVDEVRTGWWWLIWMGRIWLWEDGVWWWAREGTVEEEGDPEWTLWQVTVVDGNGHGRRWNRVERILERSRSPRTRSWR